jgi:monovalent cation:H+ antiporter-2, CPA2 family
MPHETALVATIAATLGLGLLLGLLAHRVKLPPIIGYLLAGVALGPATPGLVADVALSGQLAEIGVILLMFGVGLHFSWKDLLSVRRVAVPGALAQILVATAMGAGVAHFWGWSFGAGLIFGLALSVASTVVLLKSLERSGLLETLNGKIAVGWLIVEDLATVLVLVLLPASGSWSAGAGIGAGGWAASLALTLGKVSVFLVLMLVIGRRAFPRLLWHAGRTGSRELFTLSVVAGAVGVAYLSARVFGVSLALGAFFAGLVMRESDLSHRAAEESLPLRDAFSVLFFVSVGMLFDPAVLVREPGKVLAVLAIVVAGKSLAAALIVLAFRYPLNTALTVSAGLAQIGEFSFILAAFGTSAGVLPQEAQSLIVAGAVLSISINHLLFRLIEPLQSWVRARSSLARALERSDDPLSALPVTVKSSELTGHVVIAGYGRVGRRIGEALREAGTRFVVAEENRELVESLRESGQHAVAGDASVPAVLIQSHVARASVLAIAVPDPTRARRMIELARMLNPRVHILVRSHGDEESALLKRGGTAVFMGEEELARSMARHILERVPA